LNYLVDFDFVFFRFDEPCFFDFSRGKKKMTGKSSDQILLGRDVLAFGTVLEKQMLMRMMF
jgi:hypothetical protein